MTIFKLIFEHDIVLNPVNPVKGPREASTLEDFMKPIPTYSTFYFSATELESERFGLSASHVYDAVTETIYTAMNRIPLLLSDGTRSDSLIGALQSMDDGEALVMLQNEHDAQSFRRLGTSESFKDRIGELTTLLDAGHQVLFKVKAHHGFDIHIYSKKNLYRDFFYPFREMISPEFRFFSINGKRMKSERFFYFETWTLLRPPHGFEEVFEDTAFY